MKGNNKDTKQPQIVAYREQHMGSRIEVRKNLLTMRIGQWYSLGPTSAYQC